MAFKYTGDATLGVALTVETPKPLDNRTVVNNLDELYSIPEKYAYQGMTVANIDNGNIYMLIDKYKIKQKDGWKASYESIQIITCTEDEYKEWASNTTKDFKPIDASKTYLHAETYYYIYEDSMNDDQFYLSAEWGKKIEEQLNQKAMKSTVSQIKKDLDQTITNLSNYATLEELTSKYTPKTDLDLEDPNSFISQTLSSYYTKIESDDIFVTKESLRGEGIEGDNFVFVTQDKYQQDQQTIREELGKTIKTDGNGILESITVGQIKSPVQEDQQLVINVTKDGLYNGDNKYALESQIPKLVTLPEEEYLQKVEEGTLEQDTYYYVYDVADDSRVHITKEYLDLNYHSITQYQSWIGSRFYTKVQIDEITSQLQQSGDYVTTQDIQAYYTSEQIENRFSTKEEVESNYATKESLNNLSTQIEQDYVTKESLRGNSPEGNDDFIFVTQAKYTSDQESNSQQFTSKKLVTEELTIGNSNITENNGKALLNGKQIALTEEVPKIEYISQSEYDSMVESNSTDADTYYYTYEEEGQNKFITKEQIQQYYTKTEVNKLIQDAVADLQRQIDEMKNSSVWLNLQNNGDNLY